MSIILDGKALAASIRLQLKEEAALLPRKPGIAVILVGDNPASQLYVKNKDKDCAECGFLSHRYDLPASVSEEELLGTIDKLNHNPAIDGVLVQLPVPPHIHERRIIEAIAPEKDVDAFHPMNVGRMVHGDSLVWPCTPAGIGLLLDAYQIPVDGPEDDDEAEAEECHRHTPDLAAMTRQADILIVAAGCPGLITADMVKPGAAVIDVAMNRNPVTGKFTGDVCFDEVKEIASHITPVPGGVGPMTRAMLLRNVLTLARLHMGLSC